MEVDVGILCRLARVRITPDILPLQTAEMRKHSLLSLQEYSAALQQILPASYTDSSQHTKWSIALASVLAGHLGGHTPHGVEDLQVWLQICTTTLIFHLGVDLQDATLGSPLAVWHLVPRVVLLGVAPPSQAWEILSNRCSYKSPHFSVRVALTAQLWPYRCSYPSLHGEHTQ